MKADMMKRLMVTRKTESLQEVLMQATAYAMTGLSTLSKMTIRAAKAVAVMKRLNKSRRNFL
jgi:hypothetical protein